MRWGYSYYIILILLIRANITKFTQYNFTISHSFPLPLSFPFYFLTIQFHYHELFLTHSLSPHSLSLLAAVTPSAVIIYLSKSFRRLNISLKLGCLHIRIFVGVTSTNSSS